MSDRMSDNDLCQCGHNRGYHAPTSNHATAMGEKGCAGCRCTDFKPAATVHGTGSGEAKDWFESMPSLSDGPRGWSGYMVTRRSGIKPTDYEKGYEAGLRDALALLRAAERR